MKKIFTLLLLSSAWLSNAQNNFDPNDTSPVGYWKFEDNANLGKAEVGYGSDLVLNGIFTQVPGPIGTDNAIHKDGNGPYLECTHDIGVNGGGTTRTNTFTWMMDIRLPVVNIWHSIIDYDPSLNTDGEFFIKSDASLGASQCWANYSAPHYITANVWHRIVFVADPTAAIKWKLFVDGVDWGMGPQQGTGLDQRASLESAIRFLRDGDDGEEGKIDVAQIAIWGRPLLDAEVISTLGAATLAAPKFSAANSTLKVYPNPVSSNAKISFNLASASKNANIELIDMTGRVVENIYRGSLDQGEQTISWDLKSKYNAGTYLVKLSSENANQVCSILMK